MRSVLKGIHPGATLWVASRFGFDGRRLDFGRIRALVAVLVAVWSGSYATDAFANGRFPGADQLVVDPGDPRHLLVRATFGFVETRDGGHGWQWICEDIVGQIGTADPPIAITGDGSLVVAVPFDGVAASHDHGCSWSRAPAPLAGQLAVDTTLEPDDPASLLVLTSTNDPGADPDAAFEFLDQVVETKDNARTWTAVGSVLPRDFIATTIDVARSDPNRIYVGGVVGYPPSPIIETSLDRGQTWTRTPVPIDGAVEGLFVSAIDPHDADRLWVRAVSPPIDAFGTTPTTLHVSGDRGATWTKLAATRGSMFGFALSPDGGTLAYGGRDEGVWIGPVDGSAPFVQVSTIQNRGLTWAPSGLYASASEPIDPFAVGISTDMGQSFEAIYDLKDTCPQTCPDQSMFERACRGPWSDPTSGVAVLTGATGEACSVPWAKISRPVDAGSEAAAIEGDAGPRADAVEANGGCSCTTIARGARSRSASALAFLAALLACIVGPRLRRALGPSKSPP